MFLKTKTGRQVKLPTAEEDAVINAGIASDSDTRELNAEEFKKSGDDWQTKMSDALRNCLQTRHR